MGFGPAGPRVLPGPQQQQGLAQFASGIESILTKAKEQRDFTKGVETFDKLLKDSTDKEGNVDFQKLGIGVASSRDIPTPQKKQFGEATQLAQKQQLEKEKLAFEKEKLKSKPSLTLFQRLTLLNKQEDNRIRDARPSDPLGLMSEKEREKVQAKVNEIRQDFDKKRNRVLNASGGKEKFNKDNPEHLEVAKQALEMAEGDEEAAHELLLEMFEL